MIKLVYEDLSSFVRNHNPKKSLGLGYEAKIREFFRQYNVPDEDYTVKKDGEIVFHCDLYLSNRPINKLPNNLIVRGFLSIRNTQITKLPNNLVVTENFYLSDTKITELPNDLIVTGDIDLSNTLVKEIPINLTFSQIIVSREQQELINWIKHSKFKDIKIYYI